VDVVRRRASRPDPVLAILEELSMARSRSAAAHDLEPDEVQTQAGDALVSRLPSLRATLEEQHRFRSEQLARLEACSRQQVPSDPGAREAVLALREVDELLAAGARRALTDIELALVRMHTGRYGDCRSCGDAIPLTLLEAIPKTTLCLAFLKI
jgi:DnaK suppressor protein